MNSKFKITIPKPCHENWNKMTPIEKGRFCSSCSKTVVDFTKKSTKDIQSYLIENKNNKVCGHFYRKQLDTIVIEIPQITFQQQLSFQKLFVLALFFVMGTTLFSCQYSDGKKQQIKDIIIVDTFQKIKKSIDSISLKKDTVSNNITNKTNSKEIEFIEMTTKGDITEVIETVGEVSIIEGLIEIDDEPEEILMGFINIEEPPKFKEAKKLTKDAAKKDFNKRMQEFVTKNFNFNIAPNFELKKGKYKIHTMFDIDSLGNVRNIKVRAPHLKLKQEVIDMFQKLPKFIPGKQGNKVIKTRYTLPISFEVE